VHAPEAVDPLAATIATPQYGRSSYGNATLLGKDMRWASNKKTRAIYVSKVDILFINYGNGEQVSLEMKRASRGEPSSRQNKPQLLCPLPVV